LPVPYFHVVFTLPAIFSPLALQNPRVLYDLLFQATATTLLAVAANPDRLGAKIGFLAVLHTWGQNLMHHPHLHCVVPSGGLSADGTRWVCGTAKFFLPVRVLSRVFRGKFISLLKAAFGRGQLQFHGNLSAMGTPAAMNRLLNQSVRSDWVVYAKPPFGGPAQVLKYLARYTHRVAISNSRLLALQDGKVTFRWKDYAHKNKPGVMRLEAAEFIRRFLMHVVPPSFVRIRYYGFMANRCRAESLRRCRQLLTERETPAVEIDPKVRLAFEPNGDSSLVCCPACRQGHMRIVGQLERQRPSSTQQPGVPPPVCPDTS
jgi:hypothetical protein